MTHGPLPPRSRAHRARAGLAALALGAVTSFVSAQAPVGAEPAAAAVPTPAARGTQAPAAAPDPAEPPMRLLAQTATVAPDGDFSAFFEIDGAPPGTSLVIDLYPRIDDRAAFDESVAGTPRRSLATFNRVPVSEAPTQVPVRTGFVINLSGEGRPRRPGPWSWRLTEAGVYPVRVELVGPDGGVRQTVVTYLVREPEPDEDVDTTAVALLADIGHEPGGGPRADPTGRDNGSDTTGLRATLDPVLEVLARTPSLATSFAVDPDAAAALADDPAAADTLAALRAGLEPADHELLGAPYVDVDPTSLVRSNLEDELARQADLGTRTLTEVLTAPVADTWVLDHALDRDTLRALRGLGVRRFALGEAVLAGPPPTTPINLTTDTRSSAVVEPELFRLTGEAADPLLASHQLLGRLAALAAIGSGDAATVVRIDTATVGPDLLTAVVEGLAEPGPFLRTAPVTELFDRVPAPSAPATLTTPDPADLGRYPDLVRSTHRLLGSYASMLVDQSDLISAFERPLAATTAADLDLLDRRRGLRRIEAQLRERLSGISTPATDRVTLGARDARFPLPVRSDLDVPVKVVIDLEASDRLSFPRERIEATLEEDRTLVPIEVRTRATGDTPLRITVRTPDGRVILAESRYSVRSTAVSGVGVLLTIGAAGFLAVWWGRHWIRHRRRARHARSRFRRSPAPDDPSADDEVLVPAVGRAPDVTDPTDGGSKPR